MYNEDSKHFGTRLLDYVASYHRRLSPVSIKITVFRDAKPYRSVDKYGRFEEICSFHLQGRRFSQAVENVTEWNGIGVWFPHSPNPGPLSPASVTIFPVLHILLLSKLRHNAA